MLFVSLQNLPRCPLPGWLLPVLLVLITLFHGSTAASGAVPVLGAQGNIAQVKRYPALPASAETGAPAPTTVAPTVLSGITAKSAIIMDAADGRVLFAKAPDEPRQPASTIKVLTGIIAIRSLTGDEAVVVSREAASRPSSKMYLDPAKVYRADELISGVLLGSANDASVALAE